MNTFDRISLSMHYLPKEVGVTELMEGGRGEGNGRREGSSGVRGILKCSPRL